MHLLLQMCTGHVYGLCELAKPAFFSTLAQVWTRWKRLAVLFFCFLHIPVLVTGSFYEAPCKCFHIRKEGPLVCHSKKFFKKFNPLIGKKKQTNKHICVGIASHSVLRTVTLGKLSFSFHSFVQLGSHNSTFSLKAIGLDWSRISLFNAWGLS